MCVTITLPHVHILSGKVFKAHASRMENKYLGENNKIFHRHEPPLSPDAFTSPRQIVNFLR